MSLDEPLAPEPARGLSLIGTTSLVAALAFVAGIAVMAALIHYVGGGLWKSAPPAPAATMVPAPAATPVPQLPPGTDLASLAAREQALAGQLDQLSGRLAQVETGARAASSYATQAERLMIAFSVRRAIERGQPLGALELQLRRRFGEDHGSAVEEIVHASAQPLTLDDLRLALDAIGPRLMSAPDEGLWTHARRIFDDLIVLRQADSLSPRPSDRLKRARNALDRGQVESAMAEIAHMPGIANADRWLASARAYLGVRRALAEIDYDAMTTPATPAPVAAPPPRPAVPAGT